MSRLRPSLWSSLIVLTVLLPLSAVAASASSSALRAADADPVSRGDFVRAVVQMFSLPTDDTSPITGQRVPTALLPYVHAAADRDALEIFGRHYQLGRTITRGEAIVVLQKILNLSSDHTQSIKDVPAKGDLADAVAVALEQGWIELKEDGTIGAADPLNGREARLILRKANGEGGMEVEVPNEISVIPIQRLHTHSDALPDEEMLKTVWQILVNHYVDEEKIDPQEAAYRAAEAMVASVKDPYTTFMRPVEANDFNSQLEGSVSGIGAQVEQRDGQIVIISPLDGSPAAKAGLQANDIIDAADGVSLKGLGFLEAIGHIRGPQDTAVTLTIIRGESRFDVKVVRQKLSMPEIVASWQGTVAVVKIVQFGDITGRDFRRVITDVMKKDPTGLILDLRNNPGGYLDTAETVLSAFLPDGSTVVYVKSRDDETKEVTAGNPIVPKELKMIVLQNKGSASASEIVAGALQDDKRATIVGEQSFGKGTVQNLIPLSDGSDLKVTTARWFTPLKRAIQDKGVTPDVAVTGTLGDRDEQMLKALDLLR